MTAFRMLGEMFVKNYDTSCSKEIDWFECKLSDSVAEVSLTNGLLQAVAERENV